MNVKRILGLDLGTNSIGWALIEIDHEKRLVRIVALGSRILPMDSSEIKMFENGASNSGSLASERTARKSMRTMIYRSIVRRDRLHCVLNMLQMLPDHYRLEIDFTTADGKRSGRFHKGCEPKLAYVKGSNKKYEFLFKNAYSDMRHEIALLRNESYETTKVPQDWTLYYLRKKAITERIESDELAWVIMSFLSHRGYEKTHGADKDMGNSTTEELECVITKVTVENNTQSVHLAHRQQVDSEVAVLYRPITLPSLYENSFVNVIRKLKTDEDGLVLKTSYSIIEPEIQTDSNGKKYKVTEEFDEKNAFKKLLRSEFKEDSDWKILKASTESAIDKFNNDNNTIGIASYVYDSLVHNPNRAIHGDLYTHIDRQYSVEELKKIIETQQKYHAELMDEEKKEMILNKLYPHNETHRNTRQKGSMAELIADDVVFYQRELKPKSKLVRRCKYEVEEPKNNKDNKKYALKATCSSNPFFQEFRLWKFLHNVRVFRNEEFDAAGRISTNVEVTKEILTKNVKASLYSILRLRKQITQAAFLKLLKLNSSEYHWNYSEDEEIQCGTTHHELRWKLNRIKGLNADVFLDYCIVSGKSEEKKISVEYLLWHLLKSVKNDKERIKGLRSLVTKCIEKYDIKCFAFVPDIVTAIKDIEFDDSYKSYSEKALKKILPLMRCGEYWSSVEVEQLLQKTEVAIKEKVLQTENINGEIEDFQGLQESSACYIVYGRYSENADAQYWNKPKDIIDYIRNEFDKNSLRNPVVEKVLREMLFVVHDIWTIYGHVGEEEERRFFDRIHIEMGRELKNDSEKRKEISVRNKINRNTNSRIKKILQELKNENDNLEINVNSPSHIEKARLYEAVAVGNAIRENVDNKTKEFTYKDRECKEAVITIEELKNISKSSNPSRKDIERYRLWMEQKYTSPYTGKPIPLSKLFERGEYEVDHVLPRERITLDTDVNKVICEAWANGTKSAMTGMQFIRHINGGIPKGGKCNILTEKQYVEWVNTNIHDKKKRDIMLSSVVPEEFTSTQMNNTRYITRYAVKLLSNIVRDKEDNDDTSYSSHNVLCTNGAVTSILKKDWRLNEVWNDIIAPRFERLNRITNSNVFGKVQTINGHDVFIPTVPEELEKDFEKKRIDHRHHAMDALVTALATVEHVQYLNNVNANSVETEEGLRVRKGLKKKLVDNKDCFYQPAMSLTEGHIVRYKYIFSDGVVCTTFKDAAMAAIASVITSVKTKPLSRKVRQRMNVYKKWDESKGCICTVKEENLNDSNKHNIRMALHKDTNYGVRNLKPVSLLQAHTKETVGLVHNKTLKVVLSEIPFVKDETELELLGKLQNKLPSKLFKKIENKKIVYIELPMATCKRNCYITNLATEKDTESAKKRITSIADLQIQVILLEHLRLNDNNHKAAFSADGVKALNSVIEEKYKHKPIYQVQMLQTLGALNPINGNSEYSIKKKQYVAKEKGGNMVLGIYGKLQDNGDIDHYDRKFYVPDTDYAIESIIYKCKTCCPEMHPEEEGYKLLFELCQNDLVFVPSIIEQDSNRILCTNDAICHKVYKLVDFGYSKGYYVNLMPVNVAQMIYEVKDNSTDDAVSQTEILFDDIKTDKKGKLTKKRRVLKGEFTLSDNKPKSQRTCQPLSEEGIMIKLNCWKLDIDRLGNIIRVIK